MNLPADEFDQEKKKDSKRGISVWASSSWKTDDCLGRERARSQEDKKTKLVMAAHDAGSSRTSGPAVERGPSARRRVGEAVYCTHSEPPLDLKARKKGTPSAQIRIGSHLPESAIRMTIDQGKKKGLKGRLNSTGSSRTSDPAVKYMYNEIACGAGAVPSSSLLRRLGKRKGLKEGRACSSWMDGRLVGEGEGRKLERVPGGGKQNLLWQRMTPARTCGNTMLNYMASGAGADHPPRCLLRAVLGPGELPAPRKIEGMASENYEQRPSADWITPSALVAPCGPSAALPPSSCLCPSPCVKRGPSESRDDVAPSRTSGPAGMHPEIVLGAVHAIESIEPAASRPPRFDSKPYSGIQCSIEDNIDELRGCWDSGDGGVPDAD
ncbi:hypothetical protein C8R47DRAFT_1082781 [Mycena vitilis]|nr:hypothetical protein C8R47DRAFT_1082781 [Mycena vitilis]